MADPDEFLGAKVETTEEAKRGEEWTCAGGASIPKLGKMQVEFWTKEGTKKKMMIKAGRVNKTLIGVNRLNEAGFDVILSKNNPIMTSFKTGEIIPLRKSNGMYILDMWIQVPKDKPSDEVFRRQG